MSMKESASYKAISFGNGQVHDAQSPSIEVAKTLNCMVDPAKVVILGGGSEMDEVASFYPQMKAESQCYRDDGVSNTVINGTCPGYHNGIADYSDAVVRRLTPLECERLQGYDDGWTDIGDWTDSEGKIHKTVDTARYKALGNSIAIPFWQWLADRMVNVLKEEGVENPTMGSLFSGIGGFELVYKRAGCKPIWASEIEEFPIAVTKYHFGEE